MQYEIQVTFTVAADTPAEALDHLIGELDYLFKLENQLLSYDHPTTATELSE